MNIVTDRLTVRAGEVAIAVLARWLCEHGFIAAAQAALAQQVPVDARDSGFWSIASLGESISTIWQNDRGELLFYGYRNGWREVKT